MDTATPDFGDLDVRVMAPREFEAMRAVSVAAFGDEGIGDLLDMLRASWAWEDELSYVGVGDGEIIAHVLFTRATLDAPDRLVDVLVLSPVGVRPDLHDRGIGSKLIRESLSALAGRSEPVVFLEGNPDYYQRFGFRPGIDHGFRKPSLRIPDAAFMVLPLGTEVVPSELSGTLVYPDPFWRTDSVGLR